MENENENKNEDARELLTRMKYEHAFGTGGEEFPALRIYINMPLLPEEYEKLEEKLKIFMEEQLPAAEDMDDVKGVIEDDYTGNSIIMYNRKDVKTEENEEKNEEKNEENWIEEKK